MHDLETRAQTVVANTLKLTRWTIRPDSTMASFKADSLDAVGVIMALEREFGCSLPDDVFSPFDEQKSQLTFQELVELIERSANAQQAGS
ncbi:phosphopantetheine-binding protein [uncultured Roseibium sp.]|uniref:phosphopantetheine-binding protein n=1 Tax=uncultured Roseibium sp. TaxID=1936171 RepID=UPI00345055FD